MTFDFKTGQPIANVIFGRKGQVFSDISSFPIRLFKAQLFNGSIADRFPYKQSNNRTIEPPDII